MNKLVIQLISIVVLVVVALYAGFLVGSNFNQTKNSPQAGKTKAASIPPIQPYGLTCFSPETPNLSQDSNQFNCVSPVTNQQTKFIFKNQLNCQLLTDHIYNLSGSHWQPSQTDITPMPISGSIYNLITTIKDSVQFSLKLDYSRNEVDSTEQLDYSPKQPFVIIQNDSRIINAIRKTNTDDPNLGYEYEYLTLSKKTGKGVRTYSRATDITTLGVVFGANFFQCQ